jgi:hypothetical protein
MRESSHLTDLSHLAMRESSLLAMAPSWSYSDSEHCHFQPIDFRDCGRPRDCGPAVRDNIRLHILASTSGKGVLGTNLLRKDLQA